MGSGHLTGGKQGSRPVPGLPRTEMPAWFRFYLEGVHAPEAERLRDWLDREPLAISAMTAALRMPRQPEPQPSAKTQREGKYA